MDAWIDFARGPLFRICLTIMVLGIGYRIVVTAAHVAAAWHRAGDRRLPVSDIIRTTLGWLVPVRLLRTRPLYSGASFVFHLGVVLVPLFLAGHVSLITGAGSSLWPVLPATAADFLTIAAIAAILVLGIGRIAWSAARALSKPQDILILGVLLFLLLAGFLAGHPEVSPFAARTMLLVHILMGNLVLILVPTTKIAHCAIYPFTQMLFQLGWHFPAESGRHVAQVLGKEDSSI